MVTADGAGESQDVVTNEMYVLSVFRFNVGFQ